MKCIESVTVYANPDPLLVSRQAVFPGVTQLRDGDLLVIFSIGQAFDSADQRAHFSRSRDNGRTWTAPARLHNRDFEDIEESGSFKPLLLANGTLIATGYVFKRPHPLTPIVDPDSFELLPMENKVSFSSDNGTSWSVPSKIDIEGHPLELSGPCIQLSSGRILGAAPPFHLGATGHAGWIAYSDDNGASWAKLSEFFRSPDGVVAAWECRLCETAPGQVAVLFWAYDNSAKTNLPNHIAFSRDGGASFDDAINTGINAQASNLIALGNRRLLTIHAHREAPVGLCVRKIDISGDGFAVEAELNLFSDDALGSNSADIRKQFGSLKFGQPSLTKLANGEIVAMCWIYEDGQHIIKSYIIEGI